MEEHDTEYEVMGVLLQEFKKLDDKDARQRVLDWLARKFSLSTPKPTGSEEQPSAGRDTEVKLVTLTSFNSLADVFAQVSLEMDKDKALVAAAFFQNKWQKTEITGWEINKELKQLGHGVSNITSAISQLIDVSPSLMIQTRKEGKTRQAKKKYKVTAEGLKAIQQILNVGR